MSMLPVEIKDRCLAFWARHGCRVVPSFPLLHDDGSVYFVNAGITPFKAHMLSGGPLPLTAVLQRCLRTRWDSAGGFRFEMMTVVGMAEALPTVSALLFRLLEEELGLDRERLHCVLDLTETRLRGLTGPLPPARLHHQSGNNEALWTRWEFGYGDRLAGPGLTLVWDLGAERACGESCEASCACGRHLPLGNIVVVENPGAQRAYFDVGFGVERLASIFHGGLTGAFDPLRSALAASAVLPLPEREAARLADCHAAVCLLVEEGLRPEGKGAGYVLRKLVRTMYDCVSGQAPGDAVAALAGLVSELLLAAEPPLADSLRSAVSAMIEAEAHSYAESIARAVPRARQLLSRSKLSEGDLRLRLRDTYGLPAAEIDALFAELRGKRILCDTANER
jgi:alanyl-tRNA synthetase